jgi:hypothetical protein
MAALRVLLGALATEAKMSRIVLVPDTNFFLDHPDFIGFLRRSRATIHLDLLWPVLCELDVHRKHRGSADAARKERGWKADMAMRSITELQEHSVDGIEFELYRPREVPASAHPDAQVIDHLMHLAVEHHPKDEIVFVTGDRGLPTVLFKEEKKQRGLRHICICNADELEQRVPSFGQPTATIQSVSLTHSPVAASGEMGAEFFVTYSLHDFRHCKSQLAVHYQPKASNKWEAIAHSLVTPTVSFTDERRRLFLPFKKLGKTPGRHGMHHFSLGIRVWDIDGKTALAQDDSFCLDLALGGCYLSKK